MCGECSVIQHVLCSRSVTEGDTRLLGRRVRQRLPTPFNDASRAKQPTRRREMGEHSQTVRQNFLAFNFYTIKRICTIKCNVFNLSNIKLSLKFNLFD